MEAFGVFYLLSNFVLAESLIKLFIIVGLGALALFVGGMLIMLFVVHVVEPIAERGNEKPSQRKERLRIKELNRKRRLEHLRHPFDF